MTWYVTELGGSKTAPFELSGVYEKSMTALLIHGYATAAEASAHPQKINQAVWVEVEALRASSAVTNPGKVPGNVVNAVVPAASGVTGVLEKLTGRDLWFRIVEGIIGIALVMVGMAELTEGTKSSKIIKRFL